MLTNLTLVFASLSLLFAVWHLWRKGAPGPVFVFFLIYIGIMLVPGLFLSEIYNSANSVLRSVTPNGFAMAKNIASVTLITFSTVIILTYKLLTGIRARILISDCRSRTQLNVFNSLGLAIPLSIIVITILTKGLPQLLLLETQSVTDLLKIRTELHNSPPFPSIIFRGLGHDLSIFMSFCLAAQYSTTDSSLRPNLAIRFLSVSMAIFFLTYSLAKSPVAIYLIFYFSIYIFGEGGQTVRHVIKASIIPVTIAIISLLLLYVRTNQELQLDVLLIEITKRLFISQTSPFFFVSEMYARDSLHFILKANNEMYYNAFIHLPGVDKVYVSQILTAYLFNSAWNAGITNHLSTFFVSDLVLFFKDWWFFPAFIVLVNVSLATWIWYLIRPRWVGIAICSFLLHESNFSSAAAPMLLSMRLLFFLFLLISLFLLLRILQKK